MIFDVFSILSDSSGFKVHERVVNPFLSENIDSFVLSVHVFKCFYLLTFDQNDKATR